MTESDWADIFDREYRKGEPWPLHLILIYADWLEEQGLTERARYARVCRNKSPKIWEGHYILWSGWTVDTPKKELENYKLTMKYPDNRYVHDYYIPKVVKNKLKPIRWDSVLPYYQKDQPSLAFFDLVRAATEVQMSEEWA